MAKFHKTLTINAPVDKVFAFMDDPRNLEGIWPVTQRTGAPQP